jgi:hypothetical protein
MFRLTNRHQGAYCCASLKLCLLKQSVKMRRYEFGAVVWLHNYPLCNGMRCCAVRGASICTAQHSTPLQNG